MPLEQDNILRFENKATCGLREAIDMVLREQAEPLEAKKIQVELDIDRSARFATFDQSLHGTLERLVNMAVERSPFGSVLMITVLATSRGLEIEVADDGPQTVLQARSFIGFGRRALKEIPDRRQAFEESRNAVGLYCGRCPQGGLAWTIVVNRQQKQEVSQVA